MTSWDETVLVKTIIKSR